MPAAAGTRKYEKWRRPPIPPLDSGLRRNDEVGAVVTVAGRPPLPAGWGQAPALQGSPSPRIGVRGRLFNPLPSSARRGSAPCLWGPSVPGRSPGHVFVPIAHVGWCRDTKV